MQEVNNHINYIEFLSTDLEATKKFYSETFKWTFTDYGPNYVSFSSAGVEGGFEKTDKEISNGALIVIHHDDLAAIKQKVIEAGGKITVDTFSFPGGERFQFSDPSGYELSVWRQTTEG